jgi:superfamily II DNA or RNA helicase
MKITPFEYQAEGIAKIREALKSVSRVLCVAPTGAGKTVIFSLISLLSQEKGKVVIICVDRKELLTQTLRTLSNVGVKASGITANGGVIWTEEGIKKVSPAFAPNCYTYVCMVETLYSRLRYVSFHGLINSASLLIVDEAHKTAFVKLFDKIDNLSGAQKRRILFTATPVYPKGSKAKISEQFDSFIELVKPRKLVEMGRLVPLTYYTHKISPEALKEVKRKSDGEFTDASVLKVYDKESIMDSIILNYFEKQAGEKTLVFCVNIAHAQDTCQAFTDAGVFARVMDSENTSDEEREEILDWFKHTSDAVLVNVGIATTGFDEPSILSVIIARMIGSLALYIQICGRGARTYAGKNHCKVFDYGNNFDRHKCAQKDIDWLTEIAESEKEGVKNIVYCPACKCPNYEKDANCKSCGEALPKKEKVQTKEGGKELITFGDLKGLIDLQKVFGELAENEQAQIPIPEIPAERTATLKRVYSLAHDKKAGLKAVKALCQAYGYDSRYFWFFVKNHLNFKQK